MTEARSALITGATGRLGRALIPLLVDSVSTIRCLVLPGDPGVDSLEPFGAEVVEGDLASDEALQSATKDVDVVVHMAAQLPGPGISNRQLVDSIVSGTFNLLEAVSRWSKPETRFLYVSSSAVYGPQLPPEDVPIAETHPIRPTSVYGAAKAAGEGFVRAYSNSNGLRVSIVRPADIVEPRDFDLEHGFMTRRFDVDPSLRSLTVPVDADDRSATMSFASAAATAQGLMKVLGAESAIGEVFHIGPKSSISDLEVGESLARHHGLTLLTAPSSESPRQWILDAGKAERELGFVTEVDIDGLIA